MVMEKLPPLSQLAKILLLLLLLFLAPFISTSFRPSYLYLIFNILIVALGVEAGFLKAISGPREEKKPAVFTTVTGTAIASPSKVEGIHNSTRSGAVGKANLHAERVEPVKATETPKMEIAKRASKLKRCPSRPSLFFISSTLEEESGVLEEEEEEEEEWKEVGELSKQELFAKAEMFIGNFYSQLKMQREESWKKIHGFYHRAF
ncbi:uncharacterized protein [Typha latifolia]|uniref:uncharacterized protein n=1 Tax=Typha latifolia TaxID=4733 RepID=UPI003C2B441D